MAIRKTHITAKLNVCLVAVFTLILSTASLAQCPPAFEIAGIDFLSRMGYDAAAVGDVDADGYEDFAIAASGAVSAPGKVYIISGRTHELIRLLGEPNTTLGGIEFGYSLTGLGDINQDGHADILVGVRDYYQQHPGHAYVFSGIDGSVLLMLEGQSAKSMFGASVASAGDCNADGVNDLLIGAPKDSFGGESAGRVYLFSGSNGALLNTFTGDSLDALGFSIDGGKDINGDGLPDVVVGAPFNSDNGVNSGKVLVYSSDGVAPLYTFTGSNLAYTLRIGASLSFIGDLNADGVADIITSVQGVNVVEIHSGVDGTLIDVIPLPLNPANVIGNLVAMIAGGGDIDGDGIPDIAVGVPSFEINGVRTGQVFLYSGSDFQLFREEFTSVEKEYYGFGLDISGDYNQDGLADLIVGAIDNNENAQGAGKAYMYTCKPCCSLAGDANHDFSTNIADVTFLIGRIFSGGVAPFCADAADANGDNSVNIADVTQLISRIFTNGPAPICGTSET